jgi:hypothetical protein
VATHLLLVGPQQNMVARHVAVLYYRPPRNKPEEGQEMAGDDLERGVWEAPYKVQGVRVLLAVDRFGNVRKHAKLTPNVDPLRAADHLRALLDRIDPTPQLRLVGPAPRRGRTAARVVDPRLYTDPRSPLEKRRYVWSLARAAAAKIPRMD